MPKKDRHQNSLDALKQYQFKSDRDDQMAKKPFCVKLPIDVDEAIRGLDNPSRWARDVLEREIEKEIKSKR